jgi:hypothetical protein
MCFLEIIIKTIINRGVDEEKKKEKHMWKSRERQNLHRQDLRSNHT